MTDIAPDWATQAPAQAPAWAASQRSPGATGIGAIGQTIGDLFNSGPADHDPNALEQGIMDVNNSKAVGSLRGNYQNSVVNGLFMQPVRQAMESLGVGREHGETNAALHGRYNQAVLAARQDAQQQMGANRINSGPGRFVQQVGNVGANIVANPQYFALPAMGIGGSAAARLATAGAGNAAVGGVSDAAAQLMDMAEGAKKDFDVKQNIESTLTAGAFGAALHGAVEVAPFIADMFKNRGMDTKPPSDPRTQSSQITPMTSDHVSLNAADHAQYQQLLHTGSVDDIKDFFKGRQGPQPSWTDVNTWVEHRDNPPVSTNGVPGPDPSQQPEFNYQDEYNNHAEQQWKTQNQQAVQDHVTNSMSGWKNAPDVEVVHSPQEIADPVMREQIAKEDPKNDALGFLGADGKVRMFSGRITDPDTANAVLFHEGLGHFGLAQKFGDRLDQTIGSMLDRNVNQLAKDTTAWQKSNPGAYGGNRIRAAEEVLAEASQNGQVKAGLRDGITSAARQFGRKMGLKLSYSDGEVRNILSMAHDAVVNGKPGATENGFRGSTQDPNKFMFTGKKATNFDPNDPTAYTGEDGAVRNEIDDSRSKMYESPGDTVGSSMYHPRLFAEYPQLRDLEVRRNPDRAQGFYDTGDGYSDPLINLNPKATLDQHQILLHEVQHAIQDIEQHPSFTERSDQGTHGLNWSEAKDLPVEQEAMATEARKNMTSEERLANRPKFMKEDALGRKQTEPELLDRLDRLKADPRFWADPEFRANVVELARTLHPVEQGKSTESAIPAPSGFKSEAEARAAMADNKFMRGVLGNSKAIEDNDNNKSILTSVLDAIAGRKDVEPNVRSAMVANVPRLTNDQLWKAVEALDMQVWDKFREVNPIFAMKSDNPEVKLWLKEPLNKALLDEYRGRADARLETFGKANDNAESGNRFIMRQQAAEKNYRAEDLEGIYHALDEGYTPTERSWDEDKSAALAAGFSPSQLKKLRETNPGDLSTRLYRFQAAANLADGQIAELNKKLGTPEWSAEDQSEYIKVLADRNYLVARIKGERSELGRALNVSKAANSYSNSTMQAVADMLREEGSGLADLTDDPTKFMKVATMIKDLMDKGNPEGAHAAMAAIDKPYWEQYLTTFHYNAMLSGLSTHVKAPLDMMTGIAHDIIDHTLALPIGKMINTIEGLTGQTVKQGITANEVAARLMGVTRSVFDHEVYVKTLEALKTGEGSAVLPSGKSVPTNQQNTYMGTKNPRLGLLSKPTDLIVAQDTFFRSHAVSETLYGLGAREAEAQLKAAGTPYTRDDVMTLGATIARDPTPTMLKTARAEAEKMLLLNPNRLTSWIDKVKSIGPSASYAERFGSFVANNLAPFIRVAANSITTRIIQRSPLAVLTPSTRAALMEGGPNAHLAMARITYGTIKLGLLWGAAGAAADKLTGEGPENPDKKKELEASGWRPNAVHENGRYNTGGTLAMSLNPFDVHNSTAQMVKSMRDAYDTGANKGQVGIGLKLALGSILHSFESETWVDSIAPAVAAASSSGSSGGAKVNQFIGDEAKTWVPNILNQTGRLTNPNQVDTRAETDDIDPTNITGSVINNVQSAIPGLNNKLPTRYSVYGNPMANGQSLEGVHTMIPGLSGNGVKQTQDPAEQELNRLAGLTKAAIVTPVQRTVKLDDGSPKKLTAAEFQNYQRVAGRAIVETVRSEMSTPEWHNMSDQDKVLQVRDIQTDMKKAAREALFNGGS